MNWKNNTSIAALINRITLGSVLIAHSLYLKWFVFTLPGTAQFFSSVGLPGWLAYMVFFLEAIGGFALLIGFRTSLVAILVMPVLAGATWVHWGNGWVFTNAGGGWEYPLVLFMLCMVQLFLGTGQYALFRETA